jgi:hypothetical protein
LPARTIARAGLQGFDLRIFGTWLEAALHGDDHRHFILNKIRDVRQSILVVEDSRASRR